MEDIDKKKPPWYGNVKRMNEEKKLKQFLEWCPPGKRLLGHPRMRWIDSIDKALGKRGASIREVGESKIYERTGVWRKFVKGSPADR